MSRATPVVGESPTGPWAGGPLHAAALAELLVEEGVDHAVSVPDWVQLPLYRYLQQPGSGVRVVPCCAEDEAIAVAAGLTVGGRTPVVLLQNQGLYAAVNNVRAIALDSEIPLVLVVGQFGREPENAGRATRTSRRRIVSLLPKLLDALEIPWREVHGAEDLEAVTWAFRERAEGRTAAVVLAETMSWEGVS